MNEDVSNVHSILVGRPEWMKLLQRLNLYMRIILKCILKIIRGETDSSDSDLVSLQSRHVKISVDLRILQGHS
jgi:hypothetical protein